MSTMVAFDDNKLRIVYWHRDLPPLEAELVAEHTVEANSSRVQGTIAHRDEMWNRRWRDRVDISRTPTTRRSIQSPTPPRARRGSTAVSATSATGARGNRNQRHQRVRSPPAGTSCSGSRLDGTSCAVDLVHEMRSRLQFGQAGRGIGGCFFSELRRLGLG